MKTELKNAIENLTIDNIEKIYWGSNMGCRCGCRGIYLYPNNSDDAIEFKLVLDKAKRRLYQLNYNLNEQDLGINYYNVPMRSNDEAITIYFKFI